MRVFFITLTIAPIHIVTAEDAFQKLMKPFGSWLNKRTDAGFSWKCEKHGKGFLHYHIVTVAEIPFKEIQDTWNGFQVQAGYMASGEEYNSVDVKEMAV